MYRHKQQNGFFQAFRFGIYENLREDGYVSIDNNGDITLTDKGREIAEKIYERHNVIAGFLMQLGTSEETAYQDSCKIEHDISEESFQLIKAQYYKNKKD